MVGAGEIRINLKRFQQHRLCRLSVAFLNARARHVYPAVGVLRIKLRDFVERALRPLQVALQ